MCLSRTLCQSNSTSYLLVPSDEDKERVGDDADVAGSCTHVDTEEEEVPVVVESHAVVQPRWTHSQGYTGNGPLSHQPPYIVCGNILIKDKLYCRHHTFNVCPFYDLSDIHKQTHTYIHA